MKLNLQAIEEKMEKIVQIKDKVKSYFYLNYFYEFNKGISKAKNG
jgi:hypothetical protein